MGKEYLHGVSLEVALSPSYQPTFLQQIGYEKVQQLRPNLDESSYKKIYTFDGSTIRAFNRYSIDDNTLSLIQHGTTLDDLMVLLQDDAISKMISFIPHENFKSLYKKFGYDDIQQLAQSEEVRFLLEMVSIEQLEKILGRIHTVEDFSHICDHKDLRQELLSSHPDHIRHLLGGFSYIQFLSSHLQQLDELNEVFADEETQKLLGTASFWSDHAGKLFRIVGDFQKYLDTYNYEKIRSKVQDKMIDIYHSETYEKLKGFKTQKNLLSNPPLGFTTQGDMRNAFNEVAGQLQQLFIDEMMRFSTI